VAAPCVAIRLIRFSRAGCWAQARTRVGEFGTRKVGEVAVDGNRRSRGWDLRDSMEGERRRLSILTA
jgi:hypothetical protein